MKNINNLSSVVNIELTDINDYPMIQNMARFYVYDMSKECGHISDD